MREFWADWLPTETPFLPQNVAPRLFRYTSHAYLLDLFFNCPQTLGLDCAGVNVADGQRRVGASPRYPGPDCMICPNATELKAVERAIADGVITWHAYPQNSEPELADEHLLLDGIASVHRLDARFNQSRKTVISQVHTHG